MTNLKNPVKFDNVFECMISRKECCCCNYLFYCTVQYDIIMLLSLVINYFYIFYYYRDKHGRPMSHPDYDPRTLLVSFDSCVKCTKFWNT